MGKNTSEPHPSVRRVLEDFGENIRLARLRRGLSMQLVAERAGMSRTTLTGVENGDPSVSMASYANVLHVLGLHEDIKSVAQDDEFGRKLQDAKLLASQRSSRSNEE